MGWGSRDGISKFRPYISASAFTEPSPFAFRPKTSSPALQQLCRTGSPEPVYLAVAKVFGALPSAVSFLCGVLQSR